MHINVREYGLHEIGRMDIAAMEIGEKPIRDFRGRWNGMRVQLTFTYQQNGDQLCCYATAADGGGHPIWSGKLCLPLAGLRGQIHQALTRWHNRQHGSAAIKGFSWGDLVKSAHKIAEKVGAKKLISKTKEILSDPRFAKGMALASTIYPPLGISYAAVRSAAKLVDEARSGVEGATEKIATVKAIAEQALAKAQRGLTLSKRDLNAIKSTRAMSALYRAAKDGHDIQGWAFNLPYRNVSEAQAAPRVFPMRSRYQDGMTRMSSRR